MQEPTENKPRKYPLYTKIAAILFIVLIIYGQFYLLSSLGFFQIPLIIKEVISVVVVIALICAGIHMAVTLYEAYLKSRES